MKEGWEYKSFTSCLVKVPKQVQVKSKEYKRFGKYPIVSQEAELISGYCDDESIVYRHEAPIVIFGDHTKNIKYIDFDFVVGADGTHILSTTKNIIPKFFYYALKSIKLRDLGYARHFKLLKEKQIPVPPLSEQQRIVEYLDSSFAKIDAMKANAEKALNEAKALFQASLKSLLEPKEGWEEKKIGEMGTTKVGPFGSLLHKSDYVSYGIPLINPMHICNGCIKEDYNFAVNKDKYNELQSYIMQEGDIVIGRRGEMGRCAVVRHEHSGFLCGTGSIFFHPDTKIIYPDFLQLLLSSKKVVALITEVAGGATMLNLSSKALNSIAVEIPSLPEQYSIVKTLNSIQSKVSLLQSNFDKITQECDALKQALLKQVFE